MRSTVTDGVCTPHLSLHLGTHIVLPLQRLPLDRWAQNPACRFHVKKSVALWHRIPCHTSMRSRSGQFVVRKPARLQSTSVEGGDWMPRSIWTCGVAGRARLAERLPLSVTLTVFRACCHHIRTRVPFTGVEDVLSETMVKFKDALTNETSFRPEDRNVIHRDETPHSKRCCSVSTFIARVSRVAKNMVDRDVKVTPLA